MTSAFLLLRSVTVSLGHTDATAAEANAAFDAGVRTVTHLFNAMRPFGHRDPGIAGAALARPDVVVQIILDHIHLAAETAKVVWNAAAGRVALVTDAVAGAGLNDGSYTLGGFEVKIRDGVARGPDGVLAGSTLTMIEAVRNLHALGVPLGCALDAASSVPARVIGEHSGGLVAGSPADVTVVDDNLRGEARAHRRTRACRCLSLRELGGCPRQGPRSPPAKRAPARSRSPANSRFRNPKPGTISRETTEEASMPGKKANVQNEKQYEALKDKGMSKERAARIANSPGASSRGGRSPALARARAKAGRRPRRRPPPAARAAGGGEEALGGPGNGLLLALRDAVVEKVRRQFREVKTRRKPIASGRGEPWARRRAPGQVRAR